MRVMKGMTADDLFSFKRRATAPAEPEESLGPEKAALWGVRELTIGFGAVLLLFLLFSLAIVAPVTADTDEDSPETLAAGAIAMVLWNASMVFVVYRLARRSGGHWRNLGFHAPGPGADGQARSIGSLLGFI